MPIQTIDLTGPENVPGSRAWAAQHGVAAAALSLAAARRAVLADAVSQPGAQRMLVDVRNTAAAVAAAELALAAAIEAQDAADHAVSAYRGDELAAAQAAVDAATAAVAAELARLLAEATTSTVLTSTIDGLALRDRFRTATAAQPPAWDMTTIPFRASPGDLPLDPQLRLPAVGQPDQLALLEVLTALDERVDAIVNLVAAEAVHQLVNGNLVRSGAALDVASSGAVPDVLDVVRTPTPGHDTTHRLVVLLDAAAAPPWTGATVSAAADVDPATAAWAATVVPDPARVHLVARLVDGSGAVVATQPFTADRLGLDPLDWLRVAADPGELTARVARLAGDGWPPDVSGQVRVADPEPVPPADPGPGGGPGALVLTDLLHAAQAARALLARVRALQPADLAPPTAPAPPADPAIAAEASRRVAVAQARLDAVLADLPAAAAPGSAAGHVLDALFAASALGVAEATPQLDVVPAAGTGGTAAPWSVEQGRAQATLALVRLRAATRRPLWTSAARRTSRLPGPGSGSRRSSGCVFRSRSRCPRRRIRGCGPTWQAALCASRAPGRTDPGMAARPPGCVRRSPRFARRTTPRRRWTRARTSTCG